MSLNTVSLQEPAPIPKVVLGPSADPYVQIDKSEALETMDQVGLTHEGQMNTTVYLGGANNLFRKGLQIAKVHDRRIHGSLERNDGDGWVIRINTRYRGKDRAPEDMNRSFVHELEHVAQAERRDKNRIIGNVMIWGGALAVAIVTNVAGNKSSFGKRATATLLGFAVGHELGYKFAPHEIQARQRANEITSTAIRRFK